MIEFLIKIFTAIIFTIFASISLDKNLAFLYWGITIPLFIDCIRILTEYIIKNLSFLITAIISQSLRRNSKIRISCSYLYRIKVNDKYLLVKNSHRNSFQLVGGVYKINENSLGFLRGIGFQPDEHLPTTEKCTDDFRFFILGKNLVKFIRWFMDSKDRELSFEREFFEELIRPGFLKRETFPYPRYIFQKRIITPIMWSSHFNCWELQIHDILDLKMTAEQKSEIIELQKLGESDEIKWVTYDLIRSLGHDRELRTERFPIGEHTKWAIEEKYTKK